MTFLDQFFGPGNDLVRGHAPVAAELAPFVALVESRSDIAYLPRIMTGAGQGEVRWYFLCRTDAAQRRARELLNAFVGPSYLLFDGRGEELNPEDSIDVAVREEFGPRSFWIRVPNALPTPSTGPEVKTAPPPRVIVREKLKRLAGLLLVAPDRSKARVRPVGRVLRDFEYSIGNGDIAQAQQCLDEVRESARLAAANIEFLRVRVQAASRDWEAVLEPERLERLLALKPPRLVVQALLEGVYRKHLESCSSAGQVENAITTFRDVVRPAYAELFRSRAGLNGYAVDLLFALDAVTSVPVRRIKGAELLQRYPDGSQERAVLSAVLGGGRDDAREDKTATVSAALAAYESGDLDEAARIASAAPASFLRARVLLKIACDLGTLAMVRDAVAAVEALPTEDREAFRTRNGLRTEWEFAHALYEDGARGPGSRTAAWLPTNWLEWFDRLLDTTEWAGAVAAAAAGVQEWASEEWLTADGVVRAKTLLETPRATWAQQAFRDAAPHLVRAVSVREPDAGLRPVYVTLFEQIALDDDVSHPQWVALTKLFELELACGLSRASYVDQLDILAAHLRTLQSPLIVRPALDFLEVVCDAPCPVPDALIRFATAVHGALSACHTRLDPTSRGIFAELVRPLGLELHIPAGPTDDGDEQAFWAALSGKKIALYSLNEKATARARKAIQGQCNTVSVTCFADKAGGSPSLANAAKTVDLFVVATAAATHAATGFIEQNRAKNVQTRRVHRQGTAALVTEVAQYAREVAADDAA